MSACGCSCCSEPFTQCTFRVAGALEAMKNSSKSVLSTNILLEPCLKQKDGHVEPPTVDMMQGNAVMFEIRTQP